MFFSLSKLLWIVVAPSNLLGLTLVLGGVALFTRWARGGRMLVAVAAAFYVLAAFGPLGTLVLRPLEERFPRPPDDLAAPYGIIILGGGMDEGLSAERGVLMLGRFGSRMTEALALMRRFPNAKVVFTGGSAALTARAPDVPTESDLARRFFTAMGAPTQRVAFEDRSRNTAENAAFTRDLVRPEPGQTWLLVTSAFHMPRAVGLFRKAGFDVRAVPADYLTSGRDGAFARSRQASDGLVGFDIGIREWIGLLAYRLAGATDTVLPQP